MPAPLIAVLLVLAAYLIGSVPVGYLIGRARGVDLFREGSGNIGATNVGRVLGRNTGIAVFVLDFLKGVVPVAVIEPLARTIDPSIVGSLGIVGALPVGAAAATFLGHLFPVFLGFRGGKGVATGAGAVAVLVPVPFLIALAAWVLTVLCSRIVSLASLIAAAVLSLIRLISTADPFGPIQIAATGFCLAGSLLVIVKHRANVRRLVAGTENQIGDSAMRHTVLRILHVFAVGTWFGGAGFFNFVVAPSLFRSFDEVVATAPSDRTAHVPIIPTETTDEQKKNLGRALAGAAVGPVFPMYFAMQLGCGVVAVATALGWRNAEGGRRVHSVRVWVTASALITVVVGWTLSDKVSALRLERFDPNPAIAKSAGDAFAAWHLASLGLSVVTVALAGVALAMAATLPRESL
jgi:acyl-phosphate glycerol 3-phosphate acyltransferase